MGVLFLQCPQMFQIFFYRKLVKNAKLVIFGDIQVQIWQRCENCAKMPIFGKNCLKSAKSSHTVPTEHTFTGLLAISDENPSFIFQFIIRSKNLAYFEAFCRVIISSSINILISDEWVPYNCCIINFITYINNQLWAK